MRKEKGIAIDHLLLENNEQKLPEIVYGIKNYLNPWIMELVWNGLIIRAHIFNNEK